MAFTYCENCGEKIDDSVKFCPNCGYSKSGAPSGTVGNQTVAGNNEARSTYDEQGGGYGGNGNPYGNGAGYGQNQYGNQNPNGYGQFPYGSYPPYGDYRQYGGQPRKVNTGVMIFSIIVLLCFNTICGIIALSMAMSAPNQPTEELMERKNRNAIIACIVGVVIGTIFTALYFIYLINNIPLA